MNQNCFICFQNIVFISLVTDKWTSREHYDSSQSSLQRRKISLLGRQVTGHKWPRGKWPTFSTA